jgi:hypothetical protein
VGDAWNDHTCRELDNMWRDLEERYTNILKAFGLPINGDTDAKRGAVRILISNFVIFIQL